jgi:hypothetical protein
MLGCPNPSVRSGEWSEPEMLSTGPGHHGGLSLVIDGDAVHVIYATVQLLSFEPTTASSEIHYVTRPAAGGAWRREAVPSAGHARTAHSAEVRRFPLLHWISASTGSVSPSQQRAARRARCWRSSWR